MKKFLIILGSFGAGFVFNTETGKKLRNWAYQKAQQQIKNLTHKVDKVTTSKDQEFEEVK